LVTTYRCFSVVAIVMLVAVCALFSLSAHTATEPAGNGSPQEEVAVPLSGDTDASDQPGASVDLLGNDVTDAVARYQIDATGSLYEVHSPQTEIPKLGSPKS
jgi:hypothetical protein